MAKNKPQDPTPSPLAEAAHSDLEVEDYVDDASLKAQLQFDSLLESAKLKRLRKLVEQLKLYSQIILDNMMEKALAKKAAQEQARKEKEEQEEKEMEERETEGMNEENGEGPMSEDGPKPEDSKSEETSELENPQEPSSDHKKGPSKKIKEVDLPEDIQEVLDVDSADDVVEITHLESSVASQRRRRTRTVQIDSDSDDEAPTRRLRTRSRPQQAEDSDFGSDFAADPGSKLADDSDLEIVEVRQQPKRLKQQSLARAKKAKLAAQPVSEKTLRTRHAIEAAQTGHNQLQPRMVSGGEMKDYQLDGLEWLVSLYENGLNGILADEMGLGKTLQCIALYAHLLENGVKGPFLVVAPLSTVDNWCREFEKFAPEIRVLRYIGERDPRRRLKLKGTKKAPIDVVVTSYDIVLRDFQRLNRVSWGYLTVDEGHRLKNFDLHLIRHLRRLDTGNRLLLTGTPLQNNLRELWLLLNFILPDVFHDLEIFELWFDLSELTDPALGLSADESKRVKAEFQSDLVKNLHEILRPFLLRRLKKDAISELPPKKEYIVYLTLLPMQRVMYRAALDRRLYEVVLELYAKEYLLKNHGSLFLTKEHLHVVDKLLAERFAEKKTAAKRMRTQIYDSVLLNTFDGLPDDRSARRGRQKQEDEPFRLEGKKAPAILDALLDADLEASPEKKKPPTRAELAAITLYTKQIKTLLLWADHDQKDTTPSAKELRETLLNKSDPYLCLQQLDPLMEQLVSALTGIRVRVSQTYWSRSKVLTLAMTTCQWASDVRSTLEATLPGDDDGSVTASDSDQETATASEREDSDPGAFLGLAEPEKKSVPAAGPLSVSDFDSDTDAEVIEISDDELSLEEARESRANSTLHTLELHVKQLRLQSLVMQFRKVCATPYVYYEPFPATLEPELYGPEFAEMLSAHSVKIRMLELLLDRLLPAQHKVLVFSQFALVLDLLSLVLEKRNILHLRLHGLMDHEDRKVEIADFCSGDPDSTQVFLLSTRAGGLGLNLVQADTVILFDNDWNPQMDLQAMDRVHRIGQDKPVKVIRFVVRHTIEELLVIKSFGKRALEQMVIRQGKFQLSRVATKLAEEKVDVFSMDSVSLLAALSNRMELQGADNEPLPAVNDVLLGNVAKDEKPLLTEDELAEILNRSPDCYTAEPVEYENLTVFEAAAE